MSKKVVLSTDAGVLWPNRCARCGAKDELVSAGATIGRVTSVRPTLSGEIAVKGELLNLNYPVCQGHAKWLGPANLVTRKTAGFAALRAMIYFIGTLGLSLIPTVIIRLFVPSRTEAMPAEMAAIFVIAALAMIGLIAAYIKLPLRLVKKTDDEVTIKFKNHAYAEEFARLNKHSVRNG